MPGLQGESVVATQGSPVRRSKLSLKFFQKKEAKRTLDFSEPPPKEVKTEPEKPEQKIELVGFGPDPRSASPPIPLSCEKTEKLLPFVGLNNLGNTCYLNSILQVLFYCPGFRDGIKKLHKLSKAIDQPKEPSDDAPENPLPHIQLLDSFSCLLDSVEELQAGFLLDPESLTESELATPPRKLLQSLRQLNPMYEGFLQHDAQEVLQCLLGYFQETCDTIRKELELDDDERKDAEENGASEAEARSESEPLTDGDAQVAGKRKSDTEVGNAKKKPKSAKKSEPEQNASKDGPLTRSKRKSSGDIQTESGAEKESEEKSESASKETEEKSKKRVKLSWLRASGKQPSIFSKFCSVGKISCSSVKKQEEEPPVKGEDENQAQKNKADLSLVEHLFHGRLVLRTRCLECESFTERKEDFQDISVPVVDALPPSPDVLSEVSPDPKCETKTLKWAIGQFASVERLVGEDKYFCETCRHYTEAERSLLFDKTPEVVTIHLKRFSANSLELDPYAGLSKVNTPLHTPLNLSLEEWCTKTAAAASQHFKLFAVVMHSGVTISSGHYTAYVRVSHGQSGEPRDDNEPENERKEEAKNEYDDGEVSFTVNARGQRGSSSKVGGVGLLGGQRCPSSSQQQNSQKETAEELKCRKTSSQKADGLSDDPQRDGLLQFEGKWLLFDDSEVHSFEEADFLRACSPEMSSSSTPYLLFYRKISEH